MILLVNKTKKIKESGFSDEYDSFENRQIRIHDAAKRA